MISESAPKKKVKWSRCCTVPTHDGDAAAVRCGSRLEGLPAILAERLEGAEARLVRHLLALGDPVAEIDVGQARGARIVDQPEHHEGAEAAPHQGRLEEAVDRGIAIVDDVDEAAAEQR